MSWYWIYILGILSGWVIIMLGLFLLKSYLIERIQNNQMKKVVDEFKEPSDAELREAQEFLRGIIKGKGGYFKDNTTRSN